jgi:DNA-damage-inducible protein J
MTKTDMIRARVEPKLKNDAETILESLGLTASDAIRVFYKRIVSCKGLPFDMRVPNAETRKALAEYKKNPRGGTTFKDSKDMRKKLGH